MICPHCKKDVSDSTVAKHLASKGGRTSRRKITPEQQAMMQAAKKAMQYYASGGASKSFEDMKKSLTDDAT